MSAVHFRCGKKNLQQSQVSKTCLEPDTSLAQVLGVPASDFKPCTSRFCLEEWQDIWNSAANNKLHAIYPTVGKSIHNNLVSGRDAVIVNRLKIGHSRFTHSYLLSAEDQPICTKCDTVLTVKHILLDCPELRDVWLKYFTCLLYTSPSPRDS